MAGPSFCVACLVIFASIPEFLAMRVWVNSVNICPSIRRQAKQIDYIRTEMFLVRQCYFSENSARWVNIKIKSVSPVTAHQITDAHVHEPRGKCNHANASTGAPTCPTPPSGTLPRRPRWRNPPSAVGRWRAAWTWAPRCTATTIPWSVWPAWTGKRPSHSSPSAVKKRPVCVRVRQVCGYWVQIDSD